MRLIRMLLLFTLSAYLASGCNTNIPLAGGDGGDQANNNGDNAANGHPDTNTDNADSAASRPLFDESQQIALTDIEAAFQTLPHESPEADNELLAAALLSNGTFSSVEVGDGMLLATFLDGEPLAIFNDMPYEEQNGSPSPTTNQKALQTARSLHADFPTHARGTTDTRIVVVNNSPAGSVDGNVSKGALDTIVGMANKLGYSVTSPNTSSYAAFTASFTNIDGMVWFGHAGNAQGRFFFEIPADFPDLTPQHPDMVNKVLIRSTHLDWSQGFKTFVAANDLFVEQYWRFDPGSMLMMNTCFGASPGAQVFRNTCFDTNAKLESFFGWTAKSRFTDMAESATVLADLVMGANANYQDYHPGAGSEPTRAWSHQTALSDMGALTRKGFLLSLGRYVLTKSFTGGLGEHESDLVYRRANGSESGNADFDTVWEPGITLVTTSESDTAPSKLLISGSFGDQRGDGQVTINGNDLNVLQWTQTDITCELPNEGANASGAVLVTRNGRQSNPVNLTLWSGSVYYSENCACSDPNKLEWHTTSKFSMDVQFRADVHTFRTNPSSPPSSDFVSSGAMKGVSNVTDYDILGTVTDYLYDDNHTLTATEIQTFSRGPGFTPPRPMSQVPGHATFAVVFRPDHQKAELSTGDLDVINGEHVVSEYDSPILPSEQESDNVLSLALTHVLSLLDPSMALSAGSYDTGFLSAEKEVNTTFTGNNGDSQGTVTYSIQAGPFAATNPPDPAAPR